MEDILQLYQDATGTQYDGNMYDLLDLMPADGSESDVDVPIVDDFSESSEDESDEDNDEGSHRASSRSRPEGNEDWSKDIHDVRVENFIEDVGPQHNLGEDSEPIDYFSLILPETFYEDVVRETNNYAKFRQEKANKEDKVWYDTTVAEMKIFFHINIMFGIHQLPHYSLYWSDDDRLHVYGVADTMSKNRYEKISQYFHLSDSRSQPARDHPNYDPLYKIRPMLDTVKNNISSNFKPNKCISVDEAMISFH